ncbi:TetR/AcrR family transcriptional regulator [Paenibacillus donghaensis]|uniref:TetR/AcrR family transcriptional regulator n=1 Tax=Paenibacillus donghaensis TaxID=414771 RepID=UPI002AD46CC5|nr:TetR/AcrR family transcriptional regulator [Paenibacillus donghaensis]
MLLIARTKEFNEDQALHQAMLLFWKRGYEATSIPDLLQVMGISRSSLYATFSDKQALYIAALEHYKKTSFNKQAILERASSARAGIQQFFEQHIASAYDISLPGGCFVTNAATTLESPDEKINELIKTSFLNLEQAFCELLEKGRQSGEIDKNTDIQALSYLLLNLHQSINVMAKIGQDQQRAMKMINFVIAGM